jgi:hypothetical protein
MADGRVTMVVTGRYELDCWHANYIDDHCAHMQCWNYASKCGLHGIVKTSDRCNRERHDVEELVDLVTTMNLKYVIDDVPEGLPQRQYTVVFSKIEGDTVHYRMVEDG